MLKDQILQFNFILLFTCSLAHLFILKNAFPPHSCGLITDVLQPVSMETEMTAWLQAPSQQELQGEQIVVEVAESDVTSPRPLEENAEPDPSAPPRSGQR